MWEERRCCKWQHIFWQAGILRLCHWRPWLLVITFTTQVVDLWGSKSPSYTGDTLTNVFSRFAFLQKIGQFWLNKEIALCFLHVAFSLSQHEESDSNRNGSSLRRRPHQLWRKVPLPDICDIFAPWQISAITQGSNTWYLWNFYTLTNISCDARFP